MVPDNKARKTPAPLRVLHMYSSPNDGGATVSIAGLSAALCERGHFVTVACRPRAALLQRLEPHVPVLTLPLRGALDLLSLFRLARYLRRHRVTWINAHNGRDYPVAYLASRLAGGRCALWRRYYRLNRSAFNRKLFRHADLVFTLSEAQRDEIRDTLGVDARRLARIPNWVEPSAVSHRPHPALADCGKPFRVAVFGSIHRHKGQKEFVEAAIDVLTRRTDVCFFVVGVDAGSLESAYVHDIQASIEAAGRQADIRLLDWVPDIGAILADTTVTVVPSYGEAFGRVAAESMAAGVAVIATEVSGLREIVEHDVNGVLVPPGDTVALGRAIERVLSDAALRERLVENARMHVSREYSREHVISRVETAYRRGDPPR